MGCYDTILVPCPKCGVEYEAQTKSGDCILKVWKLEDAPPDALSNVNRHAPFLCDCGTAFNVDLKMAIVGTVVETTVHSITRTPVILPETDTDVVKKRLFLSTLTDYKKEKIEELARELQYHCPRCGREMTQLKDGPHCEYCSLIED